MLARDVHPRLGAWLIIAYFFHEGVARAYDYFSPPMFQLTRTSPPDWALRWEKLRGFIAASAVLVLWIAFWAFDSRTRMRATSSPQPAPLEPTPTPAVSASRRKISTCGGPRKSRPWTSTLRCNVRKLGLEMNFTFCHPSTERGSF